MKNYKKMAIGLSLVLLILIVSTSFITKTYSAGLYTDVSGKAGSYVLEYYDASSGTKVSCSIANEYYGMYKYTYKVIDNKTYYFYNCKEIAKSTYEREYPREQADKRAKDKGDSGIRVKSTAEAKKALDYVYGGLRIGEYYLEFAPNENIDWEAVEEYYLKTYSVEDYRQNYYTYDLKAFYEPERYGMLDLVSASTGTIKLNTVNIRISNDEKLVAEAFVDRLLPHLKGDGSDYQRILATYKYIVANTSYFVDNGYDNDLDSNTSIYDVFILRKSNCIGYSIAFSYVMDRLGIESYIVDQFEKNDPETQQFASVHTFNVVKLDGKFYIVDLTGGKFLTKVSSTTLYDNKLNISSTNYDFTGKSQQYTFESNLYNKIYNEVKQIKTTTTKRQQLTTTKAKTTSYKGTTTINRNTTPSRETTSKHLITNSTNSSTSDVGGIDSSTTINTTSNDITSKKTTNVFEEPKSADKTIGNVILVGVGVLVIVLYVIYKVTKKKKISNVVQDNDNNV